jgi:hypothetical protein
MPVHLKIRYLRKTSWFLLKQFNIENILKMMCCVFELSSSLCFVLLQCNEYISEFLYSVVSYITLCIWAFVSFPIHSMY